MGLIWMTSGISIYGHEGESYNLMMPLIWAALLHTYGSRSLFVIKYRYKTKFVTQVLEVAKNI